MSARLNVKLRVCALLTLSTLVGGCATRLETQTVRDEDTYSVWWSRTQQVPFVFHYPDGRLEAYDGKGARYSKAAALIEAEHDDRVEIYLGRFDGPEKTLCYSAPDASTNERGPTVLAALCDHQRSVVSLSNRARGSVLAAAKGPYIAWTRRKLLNGIFQSAAQEPDVRPY